MKRISLILLIGLLSLVTARAQVYDDGCVDKTVAVIGNEPVFLSDLEAEIKLNMYYGTMLNRCEVLELMMEKKLFLDQARLDSLTVDYAMIEKELDNRITNAMAYYGTQQAMEEYFKMPTYKLREAWRDNLEENYLIQNMQKSLSQKVRALTPADVKEYYRTHPDDSLPMVSTQYQLRQIVLYPAREEAERAVKEKLLEFRTRIAKGEKFSMLATLYSEDPGSAVRGGELKMSSKTDYWPAFADMAMSLKPGQVSQIVKTPDGFHIIEMIEKNGDMFNARHILLKPKFPVEERVKAFTRLDSIRTAIVMDSISFESAAKLYSEDFATKVNGGLMAHEYSGSAYFEKDMLKPQDYMVIANMKEGDISEPFESLDNEGRGQTIYKILKLEKIIPAHAPKLETDYQVILNAAMNKESMSVVDRFIDRKIKSTYIKIDAQYQTCEFKRKGWVK